MGAVAVTAGLAAIILAGWLDKYPGMKLIAPGAGGALPLLAEKLDLAVLRPAASRLPSEGSGRYRRVDGRIKPDVLMNLGRADQVDVAGLRRLAASITKHFGDGDGLTDRLGVLLAGGHPPVDEEEAERGFRDLKSQLLLRPVFHRLEHRIRAHGPVRFGVNRERAANVSVQRGVF